MTRYDFDAQMLRLLGLRFPPGTMETHWEGLQDVPIEVLRKAITQAIKTRVDFPTPSELRTDCDAVTPMAYVAPEAEGAPLETPIKLGELPNGAPIYATKDVRTYCDACHDMGMRSWWCGPEVPRYPWIDRAHCGRFGEHGSHEFVERCQCWQTNPALMRKREAQRRYASQGAPGGRGRAA